MDTIIWFIGGILNVIALTMLAINYYRERPLKKYWIMLAIGSALILIILIMDEIGVGRF